MADGVFEGFIEWYPARTGAANRIRRSSAGGSAGRTMFSTMPMLSMQRSFSIVRSFSTVARANRDRVVTITNRTRLIRRITSRTVSVSPGGMSRMSTSRRPHRVTARISVMTLETPAPRRAAGLSAMKWVTDMKAMRWISGGRMPSASAGAMGSAPSITWPEGQVKSRSSNPTAAP